MTMSTRIIVRTALVLGFTTGVAMVIGDQVGAQAQKRVVFLSIRAPTAETASQMATPEDEIAVLSVPEVGKFGFRPKLTVGGRVAVTILDMQKEPPARLGEVELEVGAKSVQSKTTPSFGLQVLRIGPS